MPTDPEILETEYGHPGEKWSALRARVETEGIEQFAAVADSWLDLMWTLDQYRIAGVPPRDMGNPTTTNLSERLGAIYRGKGNWFASLVALLLQNRTSQEIQARQRVQGFSQFHQIDLAWPAREEDVRIVVETKVTGAPGHGSTRARGALSDFSNRRKELKFAATDLKLYRRQQRTRIEHWDVWRAGAPPLCFFVWAARLRPNETLAMLITQAQGLLNTYLDGAGVIAWKLDEAESEYVGVPVPQDARVTDLDDVLYRIASEINSMTAEAGGVPPPAVTPEALAIPEEQLPESD